MKSLKFPSPSFKPLEIAHALCTFFENCKAYGLSWCPSIKSKVNGPLLLKYVQGPMVPSQIRGNHSTTRICMVLEIFLPLPNHPSPTSNIIL